MAIDSSLLSFILVRHRIGRGTDQEQRFYRDGAIARLDSYDRTASFSISVGIGTRSSASLVGIEEGDIKIAVLIAASAPIDMIKAVAV